MNATFKRLQELAKVEDYWATAVISGIRVHGDGASLVALCKALGVEQITLDGASSFENFSDGRVDALKAEMRRQGVTAEIVIENYPL